MLQGPFKTFVLLLTEESVWWRGQWGRVQACARYLETHSEAFRASPLNTPASV